MKSAKLSKRFFESTRGRIVTYLRGSQGTVNDLASHLDLTDNAVRAHLATLERDGLIKQSGLKKGPRKPHFAYELTAEGEHLFPKAYDALLNQFISVLKQRLSRKALVEALHAVGRSLAADKKKVEAKQKLEQRVQTAIRTLEELGGSPRLEEKDHQLSITSRNCPLAAVVAEHPETCQMVETLLSEIVDAEVVEECDRNETPKCRFVLRAH
jgi:predicted ArsR family transcriptional regulator